MTRSATAAHPGRVGAARRAGALLLAGLVAASTLGSLWYADWAGAATTTIVATSGVSPKSVTVAPGTTVTFRNDDGERHRFRTDDGAPARFDLDLAAGESMAVTLVTLGTYAYRDDRDRSNPAYAGTITVAAAPSTTTTTAGGGGGSPPTTVPPPTRADVRVLDRSFAPASVSVTAGSTVVWTNTSGRDHTVTADSGAFSSPTFASGTYQRTFASPGSFAYFCQLHPEMRGVVTVGAAGSAPPPTTPPPPPPPTTPPPPPPSAAPGAAPGTPGAAPTSRTMQIIDFAFRPSSLSAQVGDTIVFANDGRAPHTATARGGTFDTGVIAAGGRRSVRMGTAGTFSIFCTLHPAMSGTVRVVDASGAAPAEAAPDEEASAPGSAGAGTERSPSGSGDDPPPERGEVAVLDFEFSPPVVEVEVGAEVVWTFEGDAPHTVTSTEERFDSGILETGDTFTERFDEVGMFRYTCELHPQMTGAVKVVEPQDPAPTLAAAEGGPRSGAISQHIGFAILSAAVLLGATSLLLLAAKRFVGLAD